MDKKTRTGLDGANQATYTIVLCSTKIRGFKLFFLRIKGGANFKPTTSVHKKRVLMRRVQW
jgi:hypothetical protein